MFVIGLTGGIATGKSTVSRALAALGASIIDADILAREVVEPGQPALAEIRQRFGADVLYPDGGLNRAALAGKVFGRPEELADLNAITHPRVVARTEEILRELKASHPRGVAVIDAPLLLEAGLQRLVDEVWVVALSPEVQLKRLCQRDNLSPEEAKRRIASHPPQERRLAAADRVFWNDGPPEETRAKVEEAWRVIGLPGLVK